MTSAEERLEGRLRSGLREVAESVTLDEGAGFVPAAPPTTTPTWRRRRTLFLATACVSLVLVVGVVAVIIRSAQPPRNVTVNPTTVPNAQPSGSLLPIATEKIFPGLSHVMQRVHDYERADGPVASGEIVATTLGKTDVLFGIHPKFDTSPVYVVRLVGTFTCNTCSTPPHAVGPHGSEIVFTYSRIAGVPLGRSQIGNGQTDLSQYGRVYRLPSSSSDTVTSSSIDWLKPTPGTSAPAPAPGSLAAPRISVVPNGPHAIALLRELQMLSSFGSLTVASADDLTFPDGSVQTKILFRGHTNGLIEVRRFVLTAPMDTSVLGTDQKYQLPNGYQAAIRSDLGGNQILIVRPDGTVLNIVSSPDLLHRQPAVLTEDDLRSVASALAANNVSF